MNLKDARPRPGRSGSRYLVVLVHGWWANLPKFSIRDVEDTIHQEMPDADLMVPKYPSGVAANTDPIEVSEMLAGKIELAYRDKQSKGQPYEKVILIGYSLGSLIVRKTYVIAKTGRAAEKVAAPSLRYQWADRVERIILLAGVNRGWSLDPKPVHMSRLLQWMYRFLYPFSRVIPAGRLIHSFRKGSPFVDNLRIEWHQLERRQQEPGAERQLPTTIQLFGRKEDVVNIEDMQDIQYCKNFVFLYVDETGHFQAADFQDPEAGPVRREKFLHALLTDTGALKSDVRPNEPDTTDRVERERRQVTDVILVAHGIRDYGGWTGIIRNTIAKFDGTSGLKVEPFTPSYTRFPILGFLLSRQRQSKVEWFVNQYANALARFPKARFHFIGHSNGTYLLASALRYYPTCRFHNVALAGSVVPRRFPWDQMVMHQRVQKVANYMAANDLVVAVFPRFLEQLWEGLPIPLPEEVFDIGSGGVYGFQDNEARKYECRLHGRHSAAIAKDHHESLVRFVLGLDDTPKVNEEFLVEKIPFFTRFCSALSVLVWAALFATPFLMIMTIMYVWKVVETSGQDVAFASWLAGLTFPYLPVVAATFLVGAGIWWILKFV